MKRAILLTAALLCGCSQPIPEVSTAPSSRLTAKPVGSLEGGSVYIITDSDTGYEYMVIYRYNTGVAIQLIKKP